MIPCFILFAAQKLCQKFGGSKLVAAGPMAALTACHPTSPVGSMSNIQAEKKS